METCQTGVVRVLDDFHTEEPVRPEHRLTEVGFPLWQMNDMAAMNQGLVSIIAIIYSALTL